MIIALNKSDLARRRTERKKAEEDARDKISFAPYAPIVSISAKTGRGVGELFDDDRRGARGVHASASAPASSIASSRQVLETQAAADAGRQGAAPLLRHAGRELAAHVHRHDERPGLDPLLVPALRRRTSSASTSASKGCRCASSTRRSDAASGRRRPTATRPDQTPPDMSCSATSASSPTSCTSVASSRTRTIGTLLLARQRPHVVRVELRERARVVVGLHNARRRAVLELQATRVDRRGDLRLGDHAFDLRRTVEAVHDERAARHVVLASRSVKIDDLVDAHRRRARHEHERDLGRPERLLRPSSARCLKPPNRSFSSAMNSAIASRKPPPVIFPMPRRTTAADRASRLSENFPLDSKACDEPAHRRRVERLDEALRRVEEVERVRGRRRVEDEEVVARVVLHGDELLHRHVLLRAGERRGDVLVELVRRGAVFAFSGDDECLTTSSSKVRFVSSIIAVSEPFERHAAPLEARADRRHAPRSTSARSRATRRAAWPGRW